MLYVFYTLNKTWRIKFASLQFMAKCFTLSLFKFKLHIVTVLVLWHKSDLSQNTIDMPFVNEICLTKLSN